VVADGAALAEAAADEFVAILREAIATRGVATVALSGGSTPKAMFDVLAARGRDALAWEHVDFWWGDERTVPPTHADSNFGMARDRLLAPLAIAEARIHRMEGEREPEVAAREYERLMREALGTPPVFDLVLLGMGKDGHTASLFPQSRGVSESGAFVLANPVDSPLTGGPTVRLTLTLPAIGAARHTLFVVGGADKAEALAGVLEGPPNKYPAQLVRGADVRWLVDAAAASKLTKTAGS
jgi:6-phosphogluconolactonase